MNANELRVGNLFRWKSTNEVGVVNDIVTYGRKPTINNVNIQDAEPIPLTEEWLLRFGFEIDRPGYKLNYDFQIYTDPNGNHFPHYREYAAGRSMRFVHELQNIVFALTGQELTIKEAAR